MGSLQEISIAQARPFLFQPILLNHAITVLNISIAQARPFLFQPYLNAASPVELLSISIAQARPFLFQHHQLILDGGTMDGFQSLKRDHSSSNTEPVSPKDGIFFPISIAQARPFLFQLNRLSTRENVCTWLISIAQARPFLFQHFLNEPAQSSQPQFQSLKRDHSSSNHPGACSPITTCFHFNRSSATIPLPTRRGHAGARRLRSISIAQARPFLFQPQRCPNQRRPPRLPISIAQARPFLF